MVMVDGAARVLAGELRFRRAHPGQPVDASMGEEAAVLGRDERASRMAGLTSESGVQPSRRA
jgi:hypothetical protein